MPTALDMIKRAMRLCRVIGKGEAPDADEAQDGLTALNAMLDSWALRRLYVYTVNDQSKVLTANDGTYTVGSGGDINMTRPERLTNGCYITDGSADFPLEVIDDASWSGIAYKSQTGRPALAYLRQAIPLATLYLWPVPDRAYTLHLLSWERLQSFTALTTSLALPSGYEQAIIPSLAEIIAPEYGVPVTPDIATMAQRARAALTAGNAPRIRMQPSDDLMNVGLYGGRVTANISTF